MTARELVLKRILDRMTEEERRDYVLLSAFSSTRDDVLKAISRQDEKLELISKKQSWLNDFTANVTANAAWDTLIYIGSRILKKL